MVTTPRIESQNEIFAHEVVTGLTTNVASCADPRITPLALTDDMKRDIRFAKTGFFLMRIGNTASSLSTKPGTESRVT